MQDKIWAHSGDSHFLEPEDLWHQILPKSQADRMPRSERVGDDEEIIHVDGKSMRRPLPKIFTKKGADGLTIAELSARPPGARDVKARLADLDQEGIWGEVVYSSIGLWSALIEDPQLIREAARAENEWLVSEIQGAAPDRLVAAGLMPMLQVEDSVSELHHAQDREPANWPPTRHARLEPGLLGAPLGSCRRGRHGGRLPHRHGRR
jgi:hypothetical protein